MHRFEVAGTCLGLMPCGAAVWESARTLFVADLHLGKAAAFRASGVPVPEAVTAGTLARLDSALARAGAQRLVILGDLIHAAAGRATEVLDAVSAWRSARRELEVLLIRGNHDHSAGDPPREWGMDVLEGPVVDGPFVLMHEPSEVADGHVLCGHIHPAVVLRDPLGPSVRARCFWTRGAVTVLPSYGDFTGCRAVAAAETDRVHVLIDGEVVEWPPVVRTRKLRPDEAHCRPA